MENWWIFIVLFFLFILLIPQIFKIDFTYNQKTNFGVVKAKLFFIQIGFFTFQIKHTGIIIRTKKERKQIEYEYNDPKLKVVEQILMQIKKRLVVRFVDLYSLVGTGEAGSSAILSGFMTVIYKLFLVYLKNQKPRSVVNISSNTDFNNDVFVVTLFCKMSISILQIFQSVIVALFKKK